MWNDRHYFLEHGPAAPPRQGPGHEPIWHLLDVIAGSQQKIGRRNGNADIRILGYNENTIWIQRSVSCQSGNARGRKDRRKAWVNVTNDPLPKRKNRNDIWDDETIMNELPMNLYTSWIFNGQFNFNCTTLIFVAMDYIVIVFFRPSFEVLI